MWMILIFGIFFMGPQEPVLTEYQAPPDKDVLTNPYDADFSPEGHLYLVDSKSCRIHVWDQNGTYLKAFGGKGKGPGELELPAKIRVTGQTVWVWDYAGKVSRFDPQGRYLGSFQPGYKIRTFEPLGDDLLLIGRRRRLGSKDNRTSFELLDGKGIQLKTLKVFNNENYLTPRKDYNHVVLKAFGPEAEIQKGPGDRWYFGFSQNRTLYEINAQGEIVGERVFPIPTEKPTQADREFYEKLTLPTIFGSTLSLKKLPNLVHNFDHDKAYYTHFHLQDGKIAFVLTPIGAKVGVGNGFSRGSYYVHDFESGQVLSRGEYRFAEGSTVLFRGGRVLAISFDHDDKFQVQTLKLRGF